MMVIAAVLNSFAKEKSTHHPFHGLPAGEVAMFMGLFKSKKL